MAQGPGIWLHWNCAGRVTNDPKWENKWWIPLPRGYRSKYAGTCAFCGDPIVRGEETAKVMNEAREAWD